MKNRYALSLFVLALLSATGAYSQVSYSTASTTSFPAPVSAARCVVADFDGDGDADILYQTGGNGTAFQYARNNGNATFALLLQGSSPFAGLTLPDVINSGGNYYAADFDGDGDLDLWAAVSGTTGSYFRNDGSQFSAQSSAFFPAPATSTRCLVADFDGDKDADILYQTGANGTAFQYGQNTGNGLFSIVALGSSPFAGLTMVDHNGANYSAADIDGDGDLDVHAGVNGGAGSYYRNDGGSFSSQSTDTFPIPAAGSRMAFGDFDSDGDADILFQSGANGTPFYYALSNGDDTYSVFSQAASPFAGLTLPDHTGGNYFTGDFDNDRDPDLWVSANSATGSYFFQSGRPPYITASSPADNSGAAYRDANIVLTFNEAVSKGSGNLYLVATATNTVVETIPVSSAAVSGSGTTWTINPTTTLAANTAYALRADRKVFVDAAGAIFFGIGDNTTLNFGTSSLLPVRFLSFTAKTVAGRVVLAWEVGGNEATAFRVQHSTDGVQWTVVGEVRAGHGQSAYGFVHPQPAAGRNQYRLQAVEANGNYSYTAIQTVGFAPPVVSLQTNRVTDGVLTLRASQPLPVTIYGSDGSQRLRQVVPAGSTNLSLGTWPKGLYYLQAEGALYPFVLH